LDSTDDEGWGMEAAAVIPSSPSARPVCLANSIRKNQRVKLAD